MNTMISIEEAKKLLEQAKNSLVKNEDNNDKVLDALDSMYNIGVKRMYQEVLIKLLEKECGI